MPLVTEQGGRAVTTSGWETPIAYPISFSTLISINICPYDYESTSPTDESTYHTEIGIKYANTKQFFGGTKSTGNTFVWIACGL